MKALLLVLLAGQVAVYEGPAEVIDAERVKVSGEVFRLEGIDAAEPGQHCLLKEKLYPCGDIAVGGLMDLTAGATVRCEPSKAGARDEEGALIGRCFADGYELSEGMVYTGWALADPESGQRFEAIQATAKSKQRGLWRGAFIKPWHWRTGARLAEE